MKKTFCVAAFFIFAMSLHSLVGCTQSKKDYELQEKCGNLCKEYFKKEHGQGIFDDREHSGSISYKYHFNKKLSKCFILLDENGYIRSYDKLYKKKSLLDINDKRKYGSFYNIVGTSNACDVLEKKCNSEQEWDKLIKSYMDE